jgi:hypothetical protein
MTDEAELHLTRSHLSRLEEAIAELRARVYPQNPERFNLMAESYLNEIKRLRARIDVLTGVELAREAGSDFVIRFEGPPILEGAAPAAIVTKALSALQRSLQRMGEYVARAEFHVAEDLSSSQLARHFELEVVTVSPGSLRVGLKILPATEAAIPVESAGETVRKLSEAVRLIARRDEEGINAFHDSLPDLSFQLQVLQAVKELAPSRRRRGYAVELGGRHIGPEAVAFGPEVRSYVSRIIRATRREATQEGIVREINLDRRTFLIRTRATGLRCRYPEDLEQSVKRALDRRVRVTGTARTYLDGSLKLLTIRSLRLL